MSQTIPFDSVADLYDSYVCVDFNIPFWLNELGQDKELKLGRKSAMSHKGTKAQRERRAKRNFIL